MLHPLNLSIAENQNEMILIAHALSSPIRMEILKLIIGKNLSVKEIASEIGLPLNTTLNHINEMERAGLITTKISYRLRENPKPATDSSIISIFSFLIRRNGYFPSTKNSTSRLVPSLTSSIFPLPAAWRRQKRESGWITISPSFCYRNGHRRP